MFAGKDATINLAKSSFDSSTLNQMDISKETTALKQDMQGQLDYYEMKYTKVGWLKEWREANEGDNEEKSSADKKNE